jgi:hypothetical protein
MTAYVVQNPPHAGLQLNLVAPTAGAADSCPTGAGIGMIVTGPSSGSATVTLPLPPEDNLPGPGRQVSVPSGQTWLIPVPDDTYGPAPITVTWAGTLTGATVAVINII